METASRPRIPRMVSIALAAVVAVAAISLGAAWAAPGTPIPAVAHVEARVNDAVIASFSRCVFSSTAPEAPDLSPTTVRVRPDPQRAVCERALTTDTELAGWHDVARMGGPSAFQSIDLRMFSATDDLVVRWFLQDARPIELTTFFDDAGFGREIVTFEVGQIDRVAP